MKLQNDTVRMKMRTIYRLESLEDERHEKRIAELSKSIKSLQGKCKHTKLIYSYGVDSSDAYYTCDYCRKQSSRRDGFR